MSGRSQTLKGGEKTRHHSGSQLADAFRSSIVCGVARGRAPLQISPLKARSTGGDPPLSRSSQQPRFTEGLQLALVRQHERTAFALGPAEPGRLVEALGKPVVLARDQERVVGT